MASVIEIGLFRQEPMDLKIKPNLPSLIKHLLSNVKISFENNGLSLLDNL